jgi:MFS family permease
VLGYGLVTLITAAIPHTTSIYQLFALQAFSGIARGTAYPILMSLSINGLPDRDNATAMGFFQAVYSAGMFLGAVVAGQIGGWLGYTMLFTSSAGVAAISTLAALKQPSSVKD